MAKQRIALWDNLKLVLITLVVLGHFADFFTEENAVCRAVFLFIYAFHMPVFFFISGLFHSNKNVPQKCIFFLSGGVLLRVVLALCSRICGNPAPAFPLFHEDGVPWFLYVLAAYTALAWLARNINPRFFPFALLVLGCFIGYDAAVGDTLCLSRMIVFAPFYFAGAWADPETLLSLRKKNRWLIVPAVLLLAGWAAACLLKTGPLYALRPFLTGRHPFSPAAAPFGPLLRLGCYALSGLLGAALIVLIPARRLPVLTTMGENSLNVYFWHWPLYMLLEHFFHIKALFSMGVWGRAAFLLLAIPLTLLLAGLPVFRFPLRQVRAAIFRRPPAQTAPDAPAA